MGRVPLFWQQGRVWRGIWATCSLQGPGHHLARTRSLINKDQKFNQQGVTLPTLQFHLQYHFQEACFPHVQLIITFVSSTMELLNATVLHQVQVISLAKLNPSCAALPKHNLFQCWCWGILAAFSSLRNQRIPPNCRHCPSPPPKCHPHKSHHSQPCPTTRFLLPAQIPGGKCSRAQPRWALNPPEGRSIQPWAAPQVSGGMGFKTREQQAPFPGQMEYWHLSKHVFWAGTSRPAQNPTERIYRMMLHEKNCKLKDKKQQQKSANIDPKRLRRGITSEQIPTIQFRLAQF